MNKLVFDSSSRPNFNFGNNKRRSIFAAPTKTDNNFVASGAKILNQFFSTNSEGEGVADPRFTPFMVQCWIDAVVATTLSGNPLLLIVVPDNNRGKTNSEGIKMLTGPKGATQQQFIKLVAEKQEKANKKQLTIQNQKQILRKVVAEEEVAQKVVGEDWPIDLLAKFAEEGLDVDATQMSMKIRASMRFFIRKNTIPIASFYSCLGFTKLMEQRLGYEFLNKTQVGIYIEYLCKPSLEFDHKADLATLRHLVKNKSVMLSETYSRGILKQAAAFKTQPERDSFLLSKTKDRYRLVVDQSMPSDDREDMLSMSFWKLPLFLAQSEELRLALRRSDYQVFFCFFLGQPKKTSKEWPQKFGKLHRQCMYKYVSLQEKQMIDVTTVEGSDLLEEAVNNEKEFTESAKKDTEKLSNVAHKMHEEEKEKTDEVEDLFKEAKVDPPKIPVPTSLPPMKEEKEKEKLFFPEYIPPIEKATKAIILSQTYTPTAYEEYAFNNNTNDVVQMRLPVKHWRDMIMKLDAVMAEIQTGKSVRLMNPADDIAVKAQEFFDSFSGGRTGVPATALTQFAKFAVFLKYIVENEAKAAIFKMMVIRFPKGKANHLPANYYEFQRLIHSPDFTSLGERELKLDTFGLPQVLGSNIRLPSTW